MGHPARERPPSVGESILAGFIDDVLNFTSLDPSEAQAAVDGLVASIDSLPDDVQQPLDQIQTTLDGVTDTDVLFAAASAALDEVGAAVGLESCGRLDPAIEPLDGLDDAQVQQAQELRDALLTEAPDPT